MKRGKIKKGTAIVLLSVLLCEAGVPACAALEDISSQLAAAKSLAELDMESNAATIGILLDQCAALLPDGDPAKSTLESIQTLIESGNANSAAVCVLLDSLLKETGTAKAPGQTETAEAPAQTEASGTPVQTEVSGAPAQTEASEVPVQTEVSEAPVQTETGQAAETVPDQELYNPAVFPDAESFFQAFTVYQDMGLPVFEVADFAQTHVPPSVLVDVPSDWGNNAAGGRSLISYSPVNASGAINPKAGTLTISCFDMETEDPASAFENYEKSISDMSVTSGMQSEDVSTASLPAKKMNFLMNVGANQFTCETICFIYEETVYSIELMQGQLSAYNYFPVLGQVVQSAEIQPEGSAAETQPVIQPESPAEETQPAVQPESPAEETQPVIQPESPAAETQPAVQPESPAEETQPVIQPESPTEETQPAVQPESPAEETQPVIQPESPAEETQPAVQPESPAEETQPVVQPESPTEETQPAAPAVNPEESISSFKYQLNGHTYQFPTPVSQIDPADMQLDRQLELPYDMSSDADVDSGKWTEIINTEYFYFESSLYKEMTGITNMTGYDTVLSEGILTALIDTNGTYLNVTLPGNIHVGSAEQDILRGFPQFADQTMDGTAAFIGNDYLYACNVRDDGCNGYVIIKNDDPFYSAVSIICENSVIKEISFECLGSERAKGVFL